MPAAEVKEMLQYRVEIGAEAAVLARFHQPEIGIYPLVNCYITLENHHFQWENPLFLWSFSIAILT